MAVDSRVPTDGRWPLVSAVVPTVDRVDELDRAVSSILAQDYVGPIEVVVVFDGTPPRMPNVEVPPGRTLRVAANTRTKGLAGNRNTGYLLAAGDYLSSCDDDDEWRPDKISAQLARLAQRPDAELCATGIEIRRGDRSYERSGRTADVTLTDLLRHRHVEVCPSSSLFRRRVVDDGVLVDEGIPGGYAEDYEWLIRLARRAPLACVADPMTIIHWHEGSYFVGNWPIVEGGLAHLIDVVPEFAGDPRGQARIEGQLALAHAALGHRRQAVRLATRSLRRSARARHSYAAILVASGVISADRVAALARRVGHGV